MKARAQESGQATVEAAFLIPVLLVALLLLMQPGILLYDRLVMNAAASEACRLLATKTDAAGDMAEGCEAFRGNYFGALIGRAAARGRCASKATRGRTRCASPS